MSQEEKVISELPSDQDIEMTELMYRAFNAGGCRPICHCCFKELEVGLHFKLSTVLSYFNKRSIAVGISHFGSDPTSQEVMLCDVCDVNSFNKMTKKKLKEYEEYRNNGGGCFRINGKVVH